MRVWCEGVVWCDMIRCCVGWLEWFDVLWLVECGMMGCDVVVVA